MWRLALCQLGIPYFAAIAGACAYQVLNGQLLLSYKLL
jgi:hypothetical protein